MSNKIIADQLRKVEIADLSHYNEDNNSYFIPKKKEIRIVEDECYLLHIKPSLRSNSTLLINWNGGSLPKDDYLKVDVAKVMGKMIKVLSVGVDLNTQQPTTNFWNGWLSLDDIEILQKL